MSKETLPGHQDQPDDITCPSCGRFVGALTRCPHCGTRIEKRISVRATRIAAVLLATIGLIFLYLMSINKEIPVIQIGDIEPTMNFAYVKITGTVNEDARIYEKSGRIQSLRFFIDDGTGEIPVSAYRAQAQALVQENRIPRIGDYAEVAGSLSVSADDRILLRLQSPEQLFLTQADIPHMQIGSINESTIDQLVVLEGEITRTFEPRPDSNAPWKVVVKDETGTIPVTLWQSIYDQLPDKLILTPGTKVSVRVQIGEYRGDLQATLSYAQDIKQADESGKVSYDIEPVTDSYTPSQLNASMEGRQIVICGKIQSISPPPENSRAPWRIVLADGQTSVPVVFWDDQAKLYASKLKINIDVKAKGTLSSYKGNLQVKLQKAKDITPQEDGCGSDIDNTVQADISIGEVTEQMDGRVVSLTGILGTPRSIPKGIIYPLSDKSGSIQLLVWDSSIPGDARNGLETGRTVEVTGKVKLYKEELEIIPSSPRDIRILNREPDE